MGTQAKSVATRPASGPEHLEVVVRSATKQGAKELVERLGGGAASATALSLFLHGRPPGVRALAVLRALPHVQSAVVFAADVSPGDSAWPAHLDDLSHAHVAAKARRTVLTAGFVLDDGADAMAALAGQGTSLRAVVDASRAFVQRGLGVRWVVPASPALAYRLEPLFSLGRDEGVDVVLAPPGDRALDPDALLFVQDFIRYRLLDEDRPVSSAARLDYYEGLLAHFDPGLPASTRRVTGTRVELDGAVVKGPLPPELEPLRGFQTGTGGTPVKETERARLVQDLKEVAIEGQRALREWAHTQLTGKGRPDHGSRRKLESVLLIGAYGGEHIGDIAILGGVLFRIHERYGTTRAILVSQRAAHTRHLVPMLETPVALTVHAYDQATVEGLLAEVDGVVFAGGPLMDLPKQLTKHLYAVSVARRLGKPFVAEGIGAGPFARKPSEWVARRLVRMAERISVRTTDDAMKPLVSGLLPERGRDPAFDYLATRPETLTRIPEVDRPWLERLLTGTEGRVVVGLNVRPIRHLFTVGVSSGDRGLRTVDVEGNFYAELADGLRRFAAASEKPVSFVFFPMNAIQFGMSDLRSAYRLGRLLGPDLDFRVWEGDASLDGVVSLLRRVDIAIAMRFHAAIFALSQERPIVGIDYRVGKRDKVAALLDDCGHPDDYRRIDELTGTWLAERLSRYR